MIKVASSPAQDLRIALHINLLATASWESLPNPASTCPTIIRPIATATAPKMQLSSASSLADFTARLSSSGPTGAADARAAIASAVSSSAKTLDLSQMSLTSADLTTLLLPHTLPHVTTLNLFLNDITHLPGGLGASLPSLARLLVGANPLASLADDALECMPHLAELDVGFSEALAALPPSIGSCRALRVLHAGNGRVAALPDALVACAALEEIHAYGNCLAALPEGIGRLARLRVLSVGRNQIRELPESIGECAMLEEVHVYENALARFPKSVVKLRRLRVVNADGNLEMQAVPRSVRVGGGAAEVAAFYAR